ncbi:MAG: hypothetical protein ABI880_13360 [Acidobacteriota bacterium]
MSSSSSAVFRGNSARASRRASWLLVLVVAAAFVMPLSIRAFNRAVVGPPPGLGYLPALELNREHHPFDPGPIDNLRHGQPAWVFIGDSMLGTRIDPILLGQLSSTHDEIVSFLYNAATGPGWWYLAFKNQLVASGFKPRVIFIFFRDTNLTDTLFRLESLYGNALDGVAHEREPELNAMVAARKRGVWSAVHTAAVRAYETDVAAGWAEPGIRRWFVNWRFPDPSDRVRFDRALNERFDLANLRPDVAADLAGPNESADFARDLPTSVLPQIVELARSNGLQVCFVRVQRRPNGTTPPSQSPNLRRYVADLKTYLAASGALFHDDWGDPEQPESIYADGDHVRDRRRYTQIFHTRLEPLFR